MTSRLLLIFCLFVGCGLSSLHAQPYERTVHDTVRFAPDDVVVETRGGSITIDTWEKDAVAYDARVVSRQSTESTEETRIDVDSIGQRLSVETSFEDLDARWSFGPEVYGYGVSYPEVHYTLRLPASTSVRIDGRASDVEVTGLTGPVDVNTEEGDVDVSHVVGSVRIDSDEGTTSVEDVTGDLAIDARKGAVTVNGVEGRLLLDAQEVRAKVAVDSLNPVNIDTDEGFVTVVVPRAVGFALSAELGDEAVLEGNFDLASLREGENSYYGTVSGGGPLVRLASDEGTIRLRHSE